MSSNVPFETSRFQLPDDQEVEVVFLRDAEGKIVVRTPDELELEQKAENPRRRPAAGASEKA